MDLSKASPLFSFMHDVVVLQEPKAYLAYL